VLFVPGFGSLAGHFLSMDGIFPTIHIKDFALFGPFFPLPFPPFHTQDTGHVDTSLVNDEVHGRRHM
jgi:hypothetical protein